MKDSPYICEIKDGKIMISVGIETLLKAIEIGPFFIITNGPEFAKDVLNELQNEDETGCTPVLALFDKMADKAIENGSFNVESLDERDIRDC